MHRPDWEYKLTRCVYQEEERGAMAQDQFNTVIGSQATETSFSIRELSDSDSDATKSLRQRLREIKMERLPKRARKGGSVLLSHRTKRKKTLLLKSLLT